ncbi:dolichyl-phosphate-mannose--protein mannosyltransferase 6 [[Candida] railenensis]|uniref:Dolichyl-phosphate-mannose--protein mannosyltransferase n=1 Tax=[Candida] railenensis TaxID=45579 RepID=A0A9P0VWP6_9ASCO|nr:dolichyl-phosphate-mannose--protein mannosyltransferase 6 [[Candida] railenensis]
MSTGASTYSSHDGLKHRTSKIGAFKDEHDLQDIITKTSSLQLDEQNETPQSKNPSRTVNILSTIFLTVLSGYLRFHKIGASSKVLWDEAHFGKFGSHYIKGEYYFDVHPPLGKLLVALSGWLAGYNGDFGFDSGTKYPDDCNYVFMRSFNAAFGVLCAPVAYHTAILCGFEPLTVWLISLSVVFEMFSLTLSKFILLDSMLLLFTVTTFYCLVKFQQLRAQNKLLSLEGWVWLSVTGVSIGCVCSVKWVGLFITALVGLFTIYDLYLKHCQTFTLESGDANKISVKTYISHWISRICTLIIIPFLIYLLCFKIHFKLLKRSGTGDGGVSSLLQGQFEDNTLQNGPRSVAFGSLVTLRSHGLSPNLLHSHESGYPEGSGQQQVTIYGYKDNNNEFLIEFGLDAGKLATVLPEEGEDTSHWKQLVHDGDTVRLIHKETDNLLHSHRITSYITKSTFEVSCYSSLENSNYADEWVIEIQEQLTSPDPFFHNESLQEIHPISTNFRLKHKELGCYLGTTGYVLPKWGFGQGEVVCKYTLVANDKTTWWNVEDHINNQLSPPSKGYVSPPAKFWKEFIILNYAMMSSNNALVPDKDKFDTLSSEWWQWPTLIVGLRMGTWSVAEVKYFLIGNPAVTWTSTFSIACFVVITFVSAILWQRQVVTYPFGNEGPFDPVWNKYLVKGLLPFFAWFLNYIPYIVMGRVTYIHHYVPAQYFAIFVSGYILEISVGKLPRPIQWIIYLACYIVITGTFYYYRDLCFGMVGSSKLFAYLKLLKTWMI